MLQHQGHVTSQGVISGTVMPNAKTSCQPGDICASTTVKGQGCLYVNYMNSSNGGTPLTDRRHRDQHEQHVRLLG